MSCGHPVISGRATSAAGFAPNDADPLDAGDRHVGSIIDNDNLELAIILTQ